MYESDDYYKGYRASKIESIKILEEVLESMKSPNNNTTAMVFNTIFVEILKKVLEKLL